MGTETDALFRWTDEQRCKKGNFVRTLIGTSVNEENILSLISKYYLGGTYRLTNKRQDGDRKADIFDIVDSQEKKQLYHYVELPRSLKNRYMFIRGVPESEKAK
jgi:hypothetical protein